MKKYQSLCLCDLDLTQISPSVTVCLLFFSFSVVYTLFAPQLRLIPIAKLILQID